MKEPFEVERFCISIRRNGAGVCAIEATVKILVDGQSEMAVAEGEGPMSALGQALDLALNHFYSGLDTVKAASDFDDAGWVDAMHSRWVNLVNSYRQQIQGQAKVKRRGAGKNISGRR